ncbi:MAG: amidohydrolase [Hyphomonadaceae bacterium]
MFDAHAHLISADRGRYPPKPLRGELSPGEFDDPMTAEKLIAFMDAAGVSGACAVQRAHVYGYDNSYILDAASAYPQRFRAVVALNAADPSTPSILSHLIRERGASGVRFVAPSFPHAPLDWIESEEAEASWRAATELGAPICVHVLFVQRDTVLPALARQAARFTDVPIIVDHVGGAHPSHVELAWMQSQGLDVGFEYPESVLKLVEFGNVVMKASSINLSVSPSPAAFLARALELFGAERLIWGSDIGQSRGAYSAKVSEARAAVGTWPDDAKTAFLSGNAKRLYRATD